MWKNLGLTLVCCVALCWGRAAGQEIPKLTGAREEAVNELLRACIKAGGLKLTIPPGARGAC
jgi:hypothetical protein